jgi:hypothetical protein
MKIKYYDDILIVECDKYKYANHFKNMKGKWIDVNGKNQFAVTKEFETDLRKIVDEINGDDTEIQKYNNNLTMKVKEEYYKSFDSKPINFGELKGDKKSIRSLSSSTYASSSSDGFPSPKTPGKEEKSEGGRGEEDDEEEEEEDEDDDIEYIFEKLEELEKRIQKLEKRR